MINQVNNKLSLKYIFITNNIIESFQDKTNHYLAKGTTTKRNFILSMYNIIRDKELDKK